MKNAELIAIGLGWLGVGVNVPVMSLMLLSHGCTMAQLGLVMGVYSLTAILAEAPSGFLSDLWGRRRMFLLSRLFRLASYAALLFAHSLPPVLTAMMAQGLASACESGSLSAVLIERARRERG
ncbi:MAG: MFS transporter, partial [Eubacteriales bacterium]|nr:MFS transporter [Eubacteriales bacterium]